MTRMIAVAPTLLQRTILIVLYATGVRRTEASLLKVADVDSQRMVIHIRQGKGFRASVTSDGWPTGEEPVRFSSAALCSLSSLHIRPLPQPLTTQLPRNDNAPIFPGPATKQSASRRRRSYSKGWW